MISMMSASEILAELPKLARDERELIRLKLAELDRDGWADSDDPLSEGDKALIEARIAEHERNPTSAIPWERFEGRLRRRLGE